MPQQKLNKRANKTEGMIEGGFVNPYTEVSLYNAAPCSLKAVYVRVSSYECVLCVQQGTTILTVYSKKRLYETFLFLIQ